MKFEADSIVIETLLEFLWGGLDMTEKVFKKLLMIVGSKIKIVGTH